MALHTSNKYGRITIEDEAVAMVAAKATRECCGVADLVSRRLMDSILLLFKKEPIAKGVKVITDENSIFIDVYVLVFEGVSVEAVISSIKNSITYHVENFSGMNVKEVNVHVVGMVL